MPCCYLQRRPRERHEYPPHRESRRVLDLTVPGVEIAQVCGELPGGRHEARHEP
jgi:hypothetical protein